MISKAAQDYLEAEGIHDLRVEYPQSVFNSCCEASNFEPEVKCGQPDHPENYQSYQAGPVTIFLHRSVRLSDRGDWEIGLFRFLGYKKLVFSGFRPI
ncbi:CC/Se motif family (seleno)protein [Aerococcus sanguinicola]|uniref:CC/Se motif family (seleno)protein n=1 Tax=unclassified Aerococcus TaxID=2618060 RepID=UPI0008A43D4A|nr:MULTISPECIES: CC/Se motif family (seleno)protein [unclassified Aerococcus]KAB0647780.1 hypothetical protein F6I01_01460 [Aerococcus sanguinicola]MDK6232977.1 CC/Se motif family (seleno)protein [Aerococcus sp. UMB10185]MDK6855271.1 CC/Se motif family (seleno)protein [Aerococcus sp. UMB7533]MDK8502127.1 CC/Se motif family (seleno)protein [Aerococcus sp. UMB1112A]OFN05244.1 hypothetical protein HMPREF2626_04080 [Aerococcus sp. HMSC062A02]